MDAKVTATEGSILSTVSDIYYSKEDGQELMGKWSEFEQAANGWEMRFNSLNTDLKNYQSGTDSQFELIQKYIQFKDGEIILGQKGNKFGQRISNNKNSFMRTVLRLLISADESLMFMTVNLSIL